DDRHQKDGEQRGHQVPAALDLAVHVQEVDHVDHNLNRGKGGDDDGGRRLVGDHAAHHQPEGDGGQDHGKDEADHVILGGGPSAQHSHQIDKGEHADPDHVKEVPEQREAGQAALVGLGQAMLAHLEQQRDQPDRTERHVQTVGADQREEGRQESAALRPGAFLDQVVEFVEFDRKEAQAKAQGQDQPADQALLAAVLHRDHGKAIGDRREEQQRGVDRHQRQFKQVLG
ncbi:hypothetical protein E4T56_gene15767, partial [Termitomyces sp. T112]